MSWIRNLLGASRRGVGAQQTDFYEEGTALLRQEKLHEALTSFRLALRDDPNDTDVLQQMAVTYTRIGMADEAIRTYRRVLELKPNASGAHYGLAFLLLGRGDPAGSMTHLQAFLARPPETRDAQPHIHHAQATLEELIAGRYDAVGEDDRQHDHER